MVLFQASKRGFSYLMSECAQFIGNIQTDANNMHTGVAKKAAHFPADLMSALYSCLGNKTVSPSITASLPSTR